MEDADKTPTQLSEELATLRQRVAECEALAAEQQRAAEALRQSEERYRSLIESSTARKELERQRAEFLAMLAHDIKNSLGNILGCTALLLDKVKERNTGEEEEEEILLCLQSNVITVRSLVINYLELSRIDAGRLTLGKQPLAVNDLLRRVGQQYEGESQRRRITLEFHLQEELPAIEGDALALERIFANLLHNALKFTPELGRITVSSARQRDEMVVVGVADTGPGLAEEEPGTGLGLSIVKALVEAHGGWVEVSSTPGQGTSFMVFFPGSGQVP